MQFLPDLRQAAQTLAKGQKKYQNGDRMGALRLFEQCLSQVCASQQFCYIDILSY